MSALRESSLRPLPVASEAPPVSPKALTVGEVVARIRQAVEDCFSTPLWIEGQIQDCKYHTSGHIYLTLVDEKITDRFGQKIVLNGAFFRGANANLKFKLVDGLKVLAYGQVTTYESRSQYQLRVLRVEPRGVGALALAFEQLKKKLQAEGLFEDSRKKPIPTTPQRVGIITSTTGSAIHDMVSKLRDWFDVMILPVKVQGEGASMEIAQAIDLANRLKIADVLIVGRGGGSVEDLWAFNEEPVARAIARSSIPIISAVGHQDDWTIADYVADLRASTPTDAAKLLVREQELFVQQARELVDQLVEDIHRFFEDQEQQLDGLQGQLRLLHPLNQLERYLTQSRDLQNQLTTGIRYTMEGYDRQLQGVAGRLEALSPLAVLARGYSITRSLPGGKIVSKPDGVKEGDALETLISGGRILSQVTGVQKRDNQES